MKKKLLSMLLVGAMAVSALAGCGGNAGSADSGSTDGGSGQKKRPQTHQEEIIPLP